MEPIGGTLITYNIIKNIVSNNNCKTYDKLTSRQKSIIQYIRKNGNLSEYGTREILQNELMERFGLSKMRLEMDLTRITLVCKIYESDPPEPIYIGILD